MKKTAKWLCLVLCILMVAVSALACTTPPDQESETTAPTPQERLEAAITALTTATKCKTSMDMDMDMTVAGQQVSSKQKMEMTADESDKDHVLCSMITTTSYLGTTTEIPVYYKDGYAYTSIMGQKLKMEMSYQEVMGDNDNPFNDIWNNNSIYAEANYTENSDGTVTAKINLDDEKYQDILNSFAGSAAGAVESLTISSCSMDIVVGSDLSITSMKLSMNMEMTVQGINATAVITADYKILELGDSVTVEFPDDLDTYEEMNLPTN